MPPRIKNKQCDAKVRRGSQRVACGAILRTRDGAYWCPNRENHILRIKTGFCASGFCEGTKAHTATGVPAKTCEFILTCACTCHDTISQIFELSGMERLPQENPEYKPSKPDPWIHEWLEGLAATVPSIPGGTDDHPTMERPSVVAPMAGDAVVPPAPARTFRPTASGRSARGELETWVKRVCDYFVLGDIDTQLKLTPQRISEIIGQEEGIKPPSTGAIDAVFKRWEKLGFAVIDRKPTRFTSYTEDGIKYGLELLKKRSKMKEKLQEASAARGFRR